MRARTRRIFFASVGALCVLIFFGAHPFFAITRTTGSKILVVEGWLDRPALEIVAAMVKDRGYERVFTTGIVRPASYYLKQGESLLAEFRQPVQGEVQLKAAGLPGTDITLLAGTDAILITELQGDPQLFKGSIYAPAGSISIMEMGGDGDPVVDRAFIGGWWIGDEDVQQLAEAVFLLHADGHAERQGMTYAHLAALELEEFGDLPGDHHARTHPWEAEGRTWSTARDFIDHAHRENITSFDVVTLGVHARRTRGLYRRAAQGSMDIGIVALPDPLCKPGSWWLNKHGWLTMLKEIMGAHQPYTAD